MNGSIALVTNTIIFLFLVSDCKQINVEHATINPTGTLTNGSTVTVTCESGYTLDSTGTTTTTVACINGQLDVTLKCSAGSIHNFMAHYFNTCITAFFTVLTIRFRTPYQLIIFLLNV